MKKIFLCLFLFLPFPVFANELIPSANSGVIIEANSGKIIFEKEKDMKVSVASLTKMVAQIIILEEIEKNRIKWSDVVTVSRNASDMGGSQIYLEENEKMTVEDLMKGISVASGNDATVAMAEYIAGSEDKFVEKMNKKVQELGLKNTHFINSTGLDEDGHYSSAFDMALIARELIIHHPQILKFSSIYEDYLRKDSERKFWLVNTNKLISQYDGADGLKTGHTDAAGYCLAATAKKNNMRLIGIVLGEKDSKIRNKETIQLLDYGFKTTKLKTLKKKGSVIKKIALSKANKAYMNAILKDDLNVIEDVSSSKSYKYNISISDFDIPIKKGSGIGKIKVLDDDKVVSEQEIVADKSVRKLSLSELYFSNLKGMIFGIF